MIPFDDVRVFVEVARERSLSRAARRLGIGKAAVSKALARLEAAVGARLAERTTRTLRLTEAGAAFLDPAERGLDLLAEAETAVSSFTRSPRGRLRVSAPVSFGVRWVAPLIPGILRDHPALTIDLDVSDRYVDMVDEGFDVAVRVFDGRSGALTLRKLAPVRVVAVAAPSYLRARGRPATPHELDRHDVLMYTLRPMPERVTWHDAAGEHVVTVGGPLRSNNGEVLAAAAEAGAGVAVLPAFLVRDAVAAGRLVLLLENEVRFGDLSVYCAWPEGRAPAPKVRAFADALARAYAPVPPWDGPSDNG